MPKKTSRAEADGAIADADEAALRAFEAAAIAEIPLPADAHVIGEPVTVTSIRYPAGIRLGLRATCRRGGLDHEVSLADVVFPPGSAPAALVARYRAWLGVEGDGDPEGPLEPARPHKVGEGDIIPGRPVGGRRLGPMILAEVRCGGENLQHDVAILVFAPATRRADP